MLLINAYIEMENLETKQFIADNLHTDVKKLLLAKKSNTAVNYDFAIRQIDGLQRIRYKIPSFYKTENIIFPPKLNLEQSSSESTASYKMNLCEGEIFIDLTGGFGIDFFFISKQFKNAIYVERNKELAEIVKHNLTVLGALNTSVINADGIQFIEQMPNADCVLIDPARRDSVGSKVVLLSHCEPDVTQIYPLILTKTKLLMLKLSPMLDISAAISSLNNVCAVHVVSVANECKEILLLLRPNYHETISYFAINILKNNDIQHYTFQKTNELNSEIEFTTELSTYLYEPNSSILKAGAFKSIAKDFHLKKLHNNTHLYTSNNIEISFPGRIFKVVKVWNVTKKSISELKKNVTNANLSTRNFPLSTDLLKKKIGITDGGDTYLFGCTLKDDSKVIIECVKTI